MWKNQSSKKAQGALEYALLVIIAIAALLSMRMFMQGAIQQKYREAGDVFGDGEQYDRRYADREETTGNSLPTFGDVPLPIGSADDACPQIRETYDILLDQLNRLRATLGSIDDDVADMHNQSDYIAEHDPVGDMQTTLNEQQGRLEIMRDASEHLNGHEAVLTNDIQALYGCLPGKDGCHTYTSGSIIGRMNDWADRIDACVAGSGSNCPCPVSEDEIEATKGTLDQNVSSLQASLDNLTSDIGAFNNEQTGIPYYINSIHSIEQEIAQLDSDAQAARARGDTTEAEMYEDGIQAHNQALDLQRQVLTRMQELSATLEGYQEAVAPEIEVMGPQDRPGSVSNEFYLWLNHCSGGYCCGMTAAKLRQMATHLGEIADAQTQRLGGCETAIGGEPNCTGLHNDTGIFEDETGSLEQSVNQVALDLERLQDAMNDNANPSDAISDTADNLDQGTASLEQRIATLEQQLATMRQQFPNCELGE